MAISVGNRSSKVSAGCCDTTIFDEYRIVNGELGGNPVDFCYTGGAQCYVAQAKGRYKLQVWGAEGGCARSNSGLKGGRGGYSEGIIKLDCGDTIYAYVGQKGYGGTTSLTSAAFNGGGRGGYSNYSSSNWQNGGGGGGTDFRIGGTSLYHRVLVAGGGGGGTPNLSQSAGHGGGCSGGADYAGKQGTQTSGNAFGTGGSSTSSGEGNRYSVPGGGGGRWGACAQCSYSSSDSWMSDQFYTGGGSGFDFKGGTPISGYCVPAKYALQDSFTCAGSQSHPSTGGGTETGHLGHGYARLQKLGKISPEHTYITHPGIYHNPDLGLISMSADGQNWITIADKNVGAENVGDAGKTFQFGNNYGFPGDGDSTPITTSSAIPSLAGYEGGNPYSDNTYRTNSAWAGANKDLWRGIAFSNLLSLRRGPCPEGFHVPTNAEWINFLSVYDDLGGDLSIEDLAYWFDMPHPQVRKGNGDFSTDYIDSIYGSVDVELDHDINLFGNRAPGGGGLSQFHNILGFLGLRIHQYSESSTPSVEMGAGLINTSMYIRPFRDEPLIPTEESWESKEFFTFDFLLVGGGGGGGYAGGGGGAGGVIRCCNYRISSGGAFPVVVGARGTGWTNSSYNGCNGGDSTFNGLVAYGGGGGGRWSGSAGSAGGSGGGGSCAGGGAGCSGQGYNGGSGYTGQCYVGGGGGGAGGAGGNGSSTSGGQGGAGIQSDIDGTMRWYAAGGGGGNPNGFCLSNGGNGGGGHGGYWEAGGQGNATRYGSGGGGGGSSCSNVNNGCQGIFIMRYRGSNACVTGGTKYTYCGYTIHCFTSSGNLTLPPAKKIGRLVDFLLIGGGGGGGIYSGGGGGGGFIECRDYNELSPGEYQIVIGQGGCGLASTCSSGCNGGNSCFNGIVAYGGGGGGGSNACCTGKNGGSGGGGGYAYIVCGGAGCVGQGNAGGANVNGWSSGGGGGGAGTAGCSQPNQCTGGTGGMGKCSDISGTMQWYSGGGGGGNGFGCCHSNCGCGGGGCGGYWGNESTNASYYGGGGGGGTNSNYSKGCQGIFIIRYITGKRCMTGGTVYECDGYTIHCFTSSGTLTVIR